MLPRVYTINGLATELRMDRRAVASRLGSFPPAGEIHGRPAWRLSDVVGLLRDERPARPARDEEPFRFTPSDAMRLTHNLGVFVMPRVVAATAVECGLGMDRAFELSERVTLGMMGAARNMMGEVGEDFIDADGVSRIYKRNCVAETEWQRLREEAGEPNWTPPRPAPGWGGRYLGEEDDLDGDGNDD